MTKRNLTRAEMRKFFESLPPDPPPSLSFINNMIDRVDWNPPPSSGDDLRDMLESVESIIGKGKGISQPLALQLIARGRDAVVGVERPKKEGPKASPTLHLNRFLIIEILRKMYGRTMEQAINYLHDRLERKNVIVDYEALRKSWNSVNAAQKRLSSRLKSPL